MKIQNCAVRKLPSRDHVHAGITVPRRVEHVSCKILGGQKKPAYKNLQAIGGKYQEIWVGTKAQLRTLLRSRPCTRNVLTRQKRSREVTDKGHGHTRITKKAVNLHSRKQLGRRKVTEKGHEHQG